MEPKSLGPDEAFARDLEQLDCELDQRQPAPIPTQTVDLIAGLASGLRLVGRPQ